MVELHEILDEHAHYLAGELRKMIAAKQIKGKNLLAASIRSSVRTNDPTISGTHELSFLDDGRFVDMGVGRLRKIESVQTNGALLKAMERKPKKWYSRTAYGIVFGRLLPKLITQTQDDTVDQLKTAVKP
jgi:hypothetical protein